MIVPLQELELSLRYTRSPPALRGRLPPAGFAVAFSSGFQNSLVLSRMHRVVLNGSC